MTGRKKRKSFTTSALCAGMLFPAALLFSVAADLPHVLMITLGGLLLSIILKNAVRLNDRTIIYSVILALVTAVFTDYMIPMSDDRFEYLSSLFRLNLTIPVILYLAVAVTFFDSKKYSYAVASAATAIALAFGGNVLRLPVETRRFPAPEIVLRNFTAVYMVCIGLGGLFILLACRDCALAAITREMRHYRLKRTLIFISFLILLIPANYGAYRLFRRFETQIRSLQDTLLRSGLLQRRGGRAVFGENADLNEVISPEILKHQDEIVIRAIAAAEPGYLRGKAYTVYANGRWQVNKNPAVTTMRRRDGGETDCPTFSINRKGRAKYAVDILVSSGLLSKVLLLPGNFTQIDIIADRLKYTVDGNVAFEDWMSDGGYTVYRPADVAAAAWRQPAKPDAVTYTQLPEHLIPELDRVLAGIPELHHPALNDRRRILVLLKYFRDHFTYKIRPQPRDPVDPVLSFLTQTRQGHCELYAAGMILLLRRLGIPARYVTGFICAERHPLESYYVARLGDAHAWTEVFDRDEQRWQLADPTPPENIPGHKRSWSVLESWSDVFNKTFRQLLSDLRRGYFARAIVDFWLGVWRLTVLICYDRIRGPLLGLLAAVILIFRLRRRLLNRRARHDFDRPEKRLAELSGKYRKMQRLLTARYALDLTPASTVADLVRELSKAKLPELQQERLVRLLREYEAIRYRKTPPPPEFYADFKKRFHV
ncbi:MAG: transglutaminase domain-containing protein [Victivallaceae bacterium]|nr:transglutaminase domain-containing protein [Victivallaceae bacterium]